MFFDELKGRLVRVAPKPIKELSVACTAVDHGNLHGDMRKGITLRKTLKLMSHCWPHERGRTVVGLNKTIHGLKTTQHSPVDQSTKSAMAQIDLECLPCQDSCASAGRQQLYTAAKNVCRSATWCADGNQARYPKSLVDPSRRSSRAS